MAEAAQIEIITTSENIIELLVPGPEGAVANVPAAIAYVLDGGGLALTPGLKGSVILPFACTIQSWTLVAGNSGSITIDIWKSSFAGYPPGAANSICGGVKPQIVSGQKASSSSLGAWATALADGDVLSFSVDAASGVTLASLSLKVIRN